MSGGTRLVTGMSDTAYHADQSTLSSTGARLMLDCPARYRWDMDHRRPYAPALELGHAAHALVLGAGSPIQVVDADSWRGAAARTLRDEALEAGRIPLLEREHEQVLAMAAAVRTHPVAGPLLTAPGAVREASIYWTDEATGAACRARPDWMDGEMSAIIDYKTTSRSASPAEFGRIAARFGYHLQAAWYRDAVASITGAPPAFLHVVQETRPPYLVSVVRLDEEALEAGAVEAERARRLWVECTSSGSWPGYAPDVHRVSLPGWYVDSVLGDDDIEVA